MILSITQEPLNILFLITPGLICYYRTAFSLYGLNKIFFNYRRVTLQWCVGFCYTPVLYCSLDLCLLTNLTPFLLLISSCISDFPLGIMLLLLEVYSLEFPSINWLTLNSWKKVFASYTVLDCFLFSLSIHWRYYFTTSWLPLLLLKLISISLKIIYYYSSSFKIFYFTFLYFSHIICLSMILKNYFYPA